MQKNQNIDVRTDTRAKPCVAQRNRWRETEKTRQTMKLSGHREPSTEADDIGSPALTAQVRRGESSPIGNAVQFARVQDRQRAATDLDHAGTLQFTEDLAHMHRCQAGRIGDVTLAQREIESLRPDQ